MHFRGDVFQLKKYSDEEKLQNDLILHKELSNLYELITKMAIVCMRKNIPLIIENPYSGQHYLARYWALKPKLIDKNRYENGDYYEKPTQYFFINCEPKDNFIFEPLAYVKKTEIKHQTSKNGINKTVMRSMIHPQYANRFIRQYILDEKEVK